jgi:hypothetical protein
LNHPPNVGSVAWEPAPRRSSGGPPLWKEPWVAASDRSRLQLLYRTFLALFLGGSACLFVGAFTLPTAWNDASQFALPLGLLVTGAVTMFLGGVAFARWRTLEASVRDAQRTRVSPRTLPSGLDPISGRQVAVEEPLEYTVDMTPFLESRRRSVLKIRTKGTLLITGFTGISCYLFLVTILGLTSGSTGAGIAFGVLGALTAVIATLMTVLIYAPNFPSHPTSLEIDVHGLRVTTSRGTRPYVSWNTPNLRVFLIDTRTSVRQPETPDSASIFVFEKSIGGVPLTPEAAEGVRSIARRLGLRLESLPAGNYGALPLRRRMSLPFGSTVSVIGGP